jgi:hypothetical protein
VTWPWIGTLAMMIEDIWSASQVRASVRL